VTVHRRLLAVLETQKKLNSAVSKIPMFFWVKRSVQELNDGSESMF